MNFVLDSQEWDLTHEYRLISETGLWSHRRPMIIVEQEDGENLKVFIKEKVFD